MAHIEIENLTFSYPSAGRPSLSDVSLTIRRRGEYVVLCGKKRQRQNNAAAAPEIGACAPRKAKRGHPHQRRFAERYESAGSGREGGLRHAESGQSDRHGQGVARAGLRLGEPGLRPENHAPAGGGNGQLFRHSGLVPTETWPICPADRSSCSIWRPSWPCSRKF